MTCEFCSLTLNGMRISWANDSMGDRVPVQDQKTKNKKQRNHTVLVSERAWQISMEQNYNTYRKLI